MRNNRKKPKKFSDGDSPASTPSKENNNNDGAVVGGSVALGGAGKATDSKKSSPVSRELSRLSDDVVIGECFWVPRESDGGRPGEGDKALRPTST